MTPPAPAPAYRAFQRAAPARAPAITVELVKYLLAMVVAGLSAYYATIYGIREEVAVLKVRLEYMKERVDAQTIAIRELTTAIDAHTLAHQQAALPRSRRP